mmetsp:Transcript_23232/g.64970  ORF Transcript_23232/g.64970 Transcript_23232/m.64970 type:complete len:253 (-) Transcript_23232:201-959(-)
MRGPGRSPASRVVPVPQQAARQVLRAVPVAARGEAAPVRAGRAREAARAPEHARAGQEQAQQQGDEQGELRGRLGHDRPGARLDGARPERVAAGPAKGRPRRRHHGEALGAGVQECLLDRCGEAARPRGSANAPPRFEGAPAERPARQHAAAGPRPTAGPPELRAGHVARREADDGRRRRRVGDDLPERGRAPDEQAREQAAESGVIAGRASLAAQVNAPVVSSVAPLRARARTELGGNCAPVVQPMPCITL